MATVIDVTEDEDASHSEVFIQTRDRPGLLTDIVRTLKDVNVNVVSAEVGMQAVKAKSRFQRNTVRQTVLEASVMNTLAPSRP